MFDQESDTGLVHRIGSSICAWFNDTRSDAVATAASGIRDLIVCLGVDDQSAVVGIKQGRVRQSFRRAQDAQLPRPE